jgi:NAD(P)H-quinone oxidoreductase subunit 5
MLLTSHAPASALQAALAALILFLPFALLLPAWLASRRAPRPGTAWPLAQGISLLSLLAALLAGLEVAVHGATSVAPAAWLPAVRLDALSAMMLALTTFLGWVIVRYSRNYLAGDAGQGRYLAWLCLTLAAVWLLVMLNNLLLLCLAWTATGLALHQLLTFYRDRPASIVAAHKKFLISRAADLLTLAGTLLVFLSLDTLQIDRITVLLAEGHRVDAGLQGAAVLFVLSAILKCAQLPFHGWLLQVMEAPTPVSALLHAGIVNIGGFVLLRLAGLLETTPAAQLILVVAGSVTAALAALVMMTRISVKVMLAWSTCAQMGFMLLEIGLGAYPLALLHLLAHSLYKAHAFLGAGDRVARQRMLGIAPAQRPLGNSLRLLALAGLLLALGLAGLATGLDPRHEPALWVLGGALASSLLPLVSAPAEMRAPRQVALLIACAFGLALLYGLWHRLFANLVPASGVPPGHLGLAVAAVCLAGLLAVQQTVLGQPQGRLSRWLHPRAFAGFHLDEMFTRLTLRLWPVRMGTARRPRATLPVISTTRATSATRTSND